MRYLTVPQLSFGPNLMAFWLRFGLILSSREVKNELSILAFAGENRGQISFSLK